MDHAVNRVGLCHEGLQLLDVRVIPVAQVMIKIIDEEIIALHLDSGHCYKFDPIASAIWKLIEQDYNVEDILKELIDSYDAPGNEIQNDLVETIDFLVKEQLVRIVR
jgi:hypothetical protein